MAKPRIGLIVRVADIYIQSRPDTWANKELAALLDAKLGAKDNETVLWFDKGAEVIAERKPAVGGPLG